MTNEAKNEGSPQTPCSVWIVLWHDENRGDRNTGVHGVFADETIACDEADRMNRTSHALYFTAVSYVVTNKAQRNEEYGPPALLALVRFLAKYQKDLNDLRNQCISMTPEECKDALIMRWPVIQGTANQLALKRIGEMDYDTKLVAEAVALLRANDSGLLQQAREWSIDAP